MKKAFLENYFYGEDAVAMEQRFADEEVAKCELTLQESKLKLQMVDEEILKTEEKLVETDRMLENLGQDLIKVTNLIETEKQMIKKQKLEEKIQHE